MMAFRWMLPAAALLSAAGVVTGAGHIPARTGRDTVTAVNAPAPTAPWWKEQKIRFMWGCWGHAGADKNVFCEWRTLPREVFHNAALSGGTVFADTWYYSPAHARLAHEFGMKYFAPVWLGHLVRLPGGRAWINQDGNEVPSTVRHSMETGGLGDRLLKCPLDEAIYEQWLTGATVCGPVNDETDRQQVYERWLAAPTRMDGIREGIVDGIHVDWEAAEGGVCYCDDCFSRFLAIEGIEASLPGKADRFPWLKERDLAGAYDENFHNRRVAMFTRIREKLQAVKPDLLFSSYGTKMSDFTRAMNTPRTPFIFLDARHYWNDDRQPWWESYSARLKQEGYLYIPGSFTSALFGSQPSQVSAARWIYEASIDEDGCWIWFEHELTDEMFGAYAAADRQIRAVQQKAGRFLFRGTRDLSFVTAVEWSGRPELEQAIIARTYHLGREHLAHISNADADWPLRVRVRFPRLADGKRWTVHDPMADLYYTPDGKSSVWTSAQLQAGVTVAMEPRSDTFLLLSRAAGRADVDRSRLIASPEIDTMPAHQTASASAAVIPAEAQSTGGPPARLVYTATEQMLFEGNCGLRSVVGNAIRTVDSDGGRGRRVRQLRGYLWSPSYSPDGKRIAFVHGAGGRGQICVMDEDGSNAVNISRNRFCDRSPVWSPDGTTIAFVSDRTGDWDIHVMNADGNGQRWLAGNPGADRAPAWSPDGKRLAWESRVSDIPNVWVCGADGRNSRPLIASDQPLKIRQVEAWRDPPAIAEARPDFPDNAFYLTDPVWSPDGSRIAATGLGTASGCMVVVLDADGSWMLQVLPWIASVGGVRWSPDGTQLAGTLRCAPQETERSGVFVIQADGADKERYGRWLVDASPQGPRLGGAHWSGLNTWYSHGSAQPRRVVKTFGSVSWSPDGKTLAFSTDMDPTGAFCVYIVPVEGGAPTRLAATESAWPNEVMWRPAVP